MRQLLPTLAVIFLVTGAKPVSAEEKFKTTPYYPLQVGTKWSYRLGEDKVFLTVARHEKVGDDLCAMIESVKDGKILETEFVALRSDGIYRIATDDDKLSPAMRILRLPAWKGDSWKVDFKVKDTTVTGTVTIDREEVEVPAGKYNAIVTRATDFSIDGTKMAWATWYVKGIGIVKKEVKLGQLNWALELEKFEPAK